MPGNKDNTSGSLGLHFFSDTIRCKSIEMFAFMLSIFKECFFKESQIQHSQINYFVTIKQNTCLTRNHVT